MGREKGKWERIGEKANVIFPRRASGYPPLSAKKKIRRTQEKLRFPGEPGNR